MQSGCRCASITFPKNKLTDCGILSRPGALARSVALFAPDRRLQEIAYFLLGPQQHLNLVPQRRVAALPHPPAIGPSPARPGSRIAPPIKQAASERMRVTACSATNRVSARFRAVASASPVHFPPSRAPPVAITPLMIARTIAEASSHTAAYLLPTNSFPGANLRYTGFTSS